MSSPYLAAVLKPVSEKLSGTKFKMIPYILFFSSLLYNDKCKIEVQEKKKENLGEGEEYIIKHERREVK